MSGCVRSQRTGQRGNRRCKWEEFLRFLERQAKATLGKGRVIPTSGVVAIARRLREGVTEAVSLTMSDIVSLREKHNAHLLGEIVAIQPCIARASLTGCGLFETSFVRQDHSPGGLVACITHELVRWPGQDDQRPGGGSRKEPRSCVETSSRHSNSAFVKTMVSRLPVRVFGMIHKTLATTTKAIVEHVEREVRTQST